MGIGLITWALQDEVLDRALELEPSAVWLAFGDPRPYAARISACGARLVCQVGNESDARQALDAGAAVVVCQGERQDLLTTRQDLKAWYRDEMPEIAPMERVVWAGEGASRVRAVRSAHDLVGQFPTVAELDQEQR